LKPGRRPKKFPLKISGKHSSNHCEINCPETFLFIQLLFFNLIAPMCTFVDKAFRFERKLAVAVARDASRQSCP
jgi:MFS-type transporter involved in bile tolerance (Atg22 family)